MTDLTQFDVKKAASTGSDMELLNPIEDEVMVQENGAPVTIRLLGADSAEFRNKQREQSNKRITQMARSRKRTLDVSLSEEDECDLLAACTVGWSGIIVDDKEVEFSKENAYDLYMRFPWIREQVNAYMGDRSNFFTKN